MMTAEQLKASILQMAMQGKLVEQRKIEGTGEALFQIIQNEKKQLIAQRKIKQGKKTPEITADEVPFEIPNNWKWVRWGELSESIQYGVNAPAKEVGRIRMVRISDIQDGKVQWETVPFCDVSEESIADYLLKRNDILFARTGGTVGKSYIVKELPEEAVYAGYLIRTRYSDHLEPMYLKYFMESDLYWSQLRSGTIATAQPNCNGQTLSKMILPLPPLEEQKRIVAKIEELMPFVEQYAKASTRLNTLNASFPDQMKKSILQQAVMGKLVPQDPNDEPASVLLKKIAEEKQKLIETGVVKKDKKASSIFRGDDGLFYETIGKKTECIQDQLSFDIPDTWEWIRLRGYGEFSSGKTPSMSNPKNWIGEIPWVSPKDMKTDVISDSQMHISNEACNAMNLYPKGTLLMVVRSGILKRMLPLCVLGVDATINQDLKAFRFYYNELSEWIYYELKGFEHYILHNLVKNVTTVDSLKFDEFTDMLVPVPPRQEQIRIIQRLKVILPMIDTTWKK